MFSGIIEKIGIVSSAVSSHEGLDLKLQLPNDYLADVLSGDSVSVNGVCLTCVDIVDNYISFNLSPETLAQSSLGALTANNMVNIERALKLGDRLNGHLVSGHVDDVAKRKLLSDNYIHASRYCWVHRKKRLCNN
jgi:riboflavin synthase